MADLPYSAAYAATRLLFNAVGRARVKDALQREGYQNIHSIEPEKRRAVLLSVVDRIAADGH